MLTFMILTVILALLFDLVNGFHDAANSIATIVSTRVLSPKKAVIWAAFFNFVAMFVFIPRVADTVSRIVIIEPNDLMYVYVVFAGLAGAILWDLITWWFGLPTSSSHSLIGGIAGAGWVYAGAAGLQWDLILNVCIFIVIAPLLGFFLGFILMLMLSWLLRNQYPSAVDQWFRKGQLLSAALYSIGHGGNDAQKTMGIIVALLIAGGALHPGSHLSIYNPETLWIILSCQLAMALGTAFGGWRIVKTMGMKMTKLKPIGGFCAESAGAITLYFATLFGIPVSTTHTITGSIIGVGSCSSKYSNVHWGIAERIVWAWVLTIPATAAISAGIFLLMTKI